MTGSVRSVTLPCRWAGTVYTRGLVIANPNQGLEPRVVDISPTNFASQNLPAAPPGGSRTRPGSRTWSGSSTWQLQDPTWL